MNDFDTNFVLQLFHISDQEANTTSVEIAPNLSAVYNVLAAEDIDGDGVAGYGESLFLSSGDVWLPGLFYSASEEIYGAPGVADIEIQNELGIQAVSFGNHEFDNGNEIIAQLLSGDLDEPTSIPFDGADFPYLSANLDFSADASLSGLVTANGQDATDIPGQIAASTIVETENGTPIAVVGATTPTLATISSPSDETVITPADFDSGDPADVAALAAIIQSEVDAVLAANPDIDKVILLAHMQVLSIEQQLATLLSDVDIIVAGGSNTRLFDGNDIGFEGEPSQGPYPGVFEGADGNPVLVVNTDKTYEYVGRLVVDFDENGVIVPAAGDGLPGNYDEDISGAFATDQAGLDRSGASDADKDPEIVAIADAVEEEIVAGESLFFAVTEVFLNGERFAGAPTDGVRSQETNLGNLTADANLFYGQLYDPEVVVSIKNGGGIRTNIGSIVVPGGGGDAERLPPEGVPSAKPEGGISRNDVADVLAFDNELVLLSLTTEQLVQTLEHLVEAEDFAIDQDSGAGQVGGVNFSFDPSLPSGDRILSAAVVDEDGNLVARLVDDGELVDNGDRTFRLITLNFLADGGSDYPFPDFAATSQRVDLTALPAALPPILDDEGEQVFVTGGEQDALGQYLLAEFGDEPGDPTFDEADTPPELDGRQQNLDFREDTVLSEFDDPSGPVLFAVNAGGAAVEDYELPDDALVDADFVDLGPLGFSADDARSPFLVEGGRRLNGTESVFTSNVPGGPAPEDDPVLLTERFDTIAADPDMLWQFPVAPGSEVVVDLYFAEIWTGTTAEGARVFDVNIEGGELELDDFDVYAAAEGQAERAVVKSFATTVSDDGILDVLFPEDPANGVENPKVAAIVVREAEVPITPFSEDVPSVPDDALIA